MSGALILSLLLLGADGETEIRVGSKSFTESVLLGEVLHLGAEEQGLPSTHLREIGGTRIAWDAVREGDIDAYPEYTGTIRQEIFSGESLPDNEALRNKLQTLGLRMSKPLGFNNSYALAMKKQHAERLGITKISQLDEHPDLRLAFSNEFMNRGDGWPSLQRKYQLPQTEVTGLNHALAYQALDAGDCDVVDVYTTDPHIRLYDLQPLEDDLAHFPRYDCVVIYRAELVRTAPKFVQFITRLEGKIDDARMLSLNEQVEMGKDSEARAAADFLNQEFDWSIVVREPSRFDRIARTTVEHLEMVFWSLFFAVLVGVPLGVVSAKRPTLGQLIVGAAEILQTIPGLALLVFLSVGFRLANLPALGPYPVIVALFLYSLLPIIRNTLAGLQDVPNSLHESADALGLSRFEKLRLIELPLASRFILTGIKTTSVMMVGYAALGGLIGAGGYGQPIMTGLRLNSRELMMEGAIPAAIMAIVVKLLFEQAERFIIPRGMQASEQEK